MSTPEALPATRHIDTGGPVTIEVLALGPMSNLVYLIGDRVSGRAAVVDPAWQPGRILMALRDRDLRLSEVLITHGHDDHVNALDALLAQGSAEVHVGREEAAFWRAATRGGRQPSPSRPDDRQREVWRSAPPQRLCCHAGADTIDFAGHRIEVLPTPGHSPGGVCYRLGDFLFTGDTLFVYGCGRCDLPGSDIRRMYQSLQSLKAQVPDQVVILPGHHYAAAPSSSMREQRRANPFLHFADETRFVRFREQHNRHRAPPYQPVPRGASAW